MNAVRMAYTVLLAVAFGGALTFIILYAARSPRWYRSSTGRWLMANKGMLAALLALALLARMLHFPPPVWMISLGGFDLVVWWGVVVLIAAQRKEKDEEHPLR